MKRNKLIKTIIITAANEDFKYLLFTLLDSLTGLQDCNIDAIGVLDVGLSDTTSRALATRVTCVVQPAWDLLVAQSVKDAFPYLRAKTAKPFLPEYFPGFDCYLWLDADTWVQEKYALKWLVDASKNGAIGIVPEMDRSYMQTTSIIQWKTECLSKYYGSDATSYLITNSYYNSGVFSLLGSAPHWRIWADCFAAALQGDSQLVTDQAALNYAIWKHELQVNPLPSLCNWCCHLALPLLDETSGRLCEPNIPYTPVGIIHLTGNTKHRRQPIGRLELPARPLLAASSRRRPPAPGIRTGGHQ